jgi:dTDP-4-amino-4,6-dideoxygalactose transaminase
MIAAEYRAAVAGLPAMTLLEAPDDSTSAATMLSLRCSDAAARDRLTGVLQREAVAFHLPLTPLPQQPYYRRRSAAPQQFPVAEQLSRCVVDLPIAADPTAAEIVRTRMVLHAAARAAAGIRSVR